MTIELKVGDRVRYARAWLRSTHQYYGPIPHAKGRIIALAPVSDTRAIATIDWGDPDIPAKVLTCNLVREDRVQFERN